MKRPATAGTKRCWAAVLLACAAAQALAAAPTHLASDESVELTFLVRRATADSLATASLLAHLVRSPEGGNANKSVDPTKLIQRAVQLAPDRPELVWLELRNCQIVQCSEEMAIAARLKKMDPENGLAWLPDLRIVPADDSGGATTVLDHIGSLHPTLYWNKLAVMMFDALTHGPGAPPATALTHDADDRLSHVIGVLASVSAPAFQVLARDCKGDELEEAGRRTACQKVATRLDQADAVVEQNVSMTLQQSLASTGPEKEALQRKYLQQRYQTVASNRARDDQVNSDADMRVAQMRKLAREQDVETAMLNAFHEPLTRPPEWRSPGVVD